MQDGTLTTAPGGGRARAGTVPQRLAYLVSQYPTIAHTFLLREIRALRSSGFDVMVISVRPADRPAESLLPEEREEWCLTRVITTAGWLRVAAIHGRVFLRLPLGYLRGLASAVRMAGWDLRRGAAHLAYFAEAVVAGQWACMEGYTWLHSHFTSTVALLARRVFGLRLSLTLHGSDEFTDPAGFRLAEKVAAASLVCTISQFGRSQVMRFSDPRDWGKIEVLPLGVDTEVYSPRPFRPDPEIFELVSVGRLVAVKGFPALLAAVEQLLGEGRRLRLRVAGDGPQRAALAEELERRNLSAHVRLEGNMNREEILALYRSADAFGLASFAEGVPVALMEAMAMEIPCVATRITGIPELIRDGVEGLLVTPSSVTELAEAIARLMDAPQLRRTLGENARKRVVERYDLANNAAAQAETFRRYLSN
jgi:colanic acid/amylovoran biosynthesis glycosyltransferase